MQLTQSVTDGLSLIRKINLSDELFGQLLDVCFGVLSRKNSLRDAVKLNADKATEMREIYVSLLALIIECVKEDITEDTIKSTLKHFTDSKLKLFLSKLSNNKKIVSDKLGRIQSGQPRIVDASWRLDHIVQSNTQSHIGESLYYIVLTTEQNNKIDFIEFTCDLHQLQELSSSLKEIVKHAEKICSA